MTNSSNVIKKKVLPEFFHALETGKKNWELRLNDFDANVGDTLVLEEWDPKTQEYTGRILEKVIKGINKFTLEDFYRFWPEEQVRERGFQIFSLE